MSAFGDPDGVDEDDSIAEDELPERIIVVRDEIGSSDPDEAAAELEALAAEVAGTDEGGGEPDPVRTIDIDAPSDPDELQAELDALAVEVGGEAIDLDEVDLRAARTDTAGDDAVPVIDLAGAETRGDAEPLGGREPLGDDRAADDVESLGHLEPVGDDGAADDVESLGRLEPLGDDPSKDIESLGGLDATVDDPGSDAESLGHLEPVGDDDPADDVESLGHLQPVGDDEPAPLEDLAVATASLGRIASTGQHQPHRSGRDETGPGTLRPLVPEPVVIAARSTRPPSMARRTVSRLRALIGLVIVVILAGVGLAGAIGAAVLLVVLALSRAFGSGG